MNKIKLVSVGGCAGYDILMTGTAWRNKFYLNARYMGSISRGYFKPGKISERLLEELPTLDKNFPSSMRNQLQGQIKAICKVETIESIIKMQMPNTIVIIDPAYELSDYYDDGEESFDIFPDWENFVPYLPSWLVEKVAKNRFKFDMASPRVEKQRVDTYTDIFRLLTEQKCLAFFIDNVATEKSYIRKLNSISSTISAFNSKVTFLTATQDGKQSILNFNYAMRLIERLYRIVKTNKERYYVGEHEHKAAWFDIDREMCFADPEHRWGYHPTHLHHLCRAALVDRFHSELLDLYNKNVKILES